jgi:hypothetical protein
MEIERIIYETTREIYNIEDKLRIATIFLFCYEKDDKLFAELLYTKDHAKYIDKLNQQFKGFDIDFTITLSDRNINNSFLKTVERVREKYDNGYYKGLFEGDEYAEVIYDIVNYDFDKIKFKAQTNEISSQLSMAF